MYTIPSIKTAPWRSSALIVAMLALAVMLQGIGYSRTLASHQRQSVKHFIPGLQIWSDQCFYFPYLSLTGNYDGSRLAEPPSDTLMIQNAALMINIGLASLVAGELRRRRYLAVGAAALVLLIAIFSFGLHTGSICQIGQGFR